MNKIIGTAFTTALLFGAGTTAMAAPFDIIVTYVEEGTPQDNDDDGIFAPAQAFTARQKQLFGVAETFWETVLTGYTGIAAPVYNLSASLVPEDGVDGSLAFAGPRSFESVAGTTNPANGNEFVRATSGIMQFDADDFAPDGGVQTEQLFLDSAIHEVAHALGFGTLFEANGLVDPNDGDLYTGANALNAFNDVNDVSFSSILLEAGGGHWNECWVKEITDEFCDPDFFNDPELMTPFAVDFKASLSAATIAAFRDLGYTTIDPRSGLGLPDVPAAIPLPAGSILLLSGLFGLGAAARRKRLV